MISRAPAAVAHDNNHPVHTAGMLAPTQLEVIATPEYPIEGLQANDHFHVRVSLQYHENTAVAIDQQERNPLDVVCVLDNSGSMQGDKIENLKKAIEFVLSVLNERDRLSIVTFNSSASLVTHFKAMTGEMKGKMRADVLPTIQAGGGTDIYDGLRLGYETLQGRRLGVNETSVMFLLTDGQDRGRLAEKTRIVKEMRAAGTALFVFGFGTDHDSQHMTDIANACEGSFIYVDTDDTVIDAFGGAIGSQQGTVLRQIEVDLQTISAGLRVQEIQSGSYRHTIESSTRTTGKVTCSDLFQGEKRDFLVRLALPTVPKPISEYALLNAVASFSLTAAASASGGSSSRERVSTACAIDRVDETQNPESFATVHQRNLLVDTDIFRVRCMNAMASAIALADRNNFEDAKKVLQDAKRVLAEQSVAYRTGTNVVLNGLMSDLEDCLARTTSREEYDRRGGRAMISEYFDGHSKQRKLYSKGPTPSSYQTTSSAAVQSAAFRSKTTSHQVFPPPASLVPQPSAVASPAPQQAEAAPSSSSSSSMTSIFNMFAGSSNKNVDNGKK